MSSFISNIGYIYLRFRDAGKEVINVLSKFSDCVERASVDEAYIDLTEEVKRRMDKRAQPELLQNTHIVGFEQEGILKCQLFYSIDNFCGGHAAFTHITSQKG